MPDTDEEARDLYKLVGRYEEFTLSVENRLEKIEVAQADMGKKVTRICSGASATQQQVDDLDKAFNVHKTDARAHHDPGDETLRERMGRHKGEIVVTTGASGGLLALLMFLYKLASTVLQ